MKSSKGFIVVALIAVCVVAGLFLTSLYMVDKDEMAVITRFGKFTATQQPGLNFKLPFENFSDGFLFFIRKCFSLTVLIL